MRFRRLLGAAIVLVCIAVPVVESFDSWDHALENDTEANVVIAALCVGFALTLATTVLVSDIRAIPTDNRFRLRPHSFVDSLAFTLPSPVPTSSPPGTALRI
jgi:hypothetical protein